jgi:aspartyl-tRNA(Asn)/glutamyl-tRNA(Gln) amidotransferase subunit A
LEAVYFAEVRESRPAAQPHQFESSSLKGMSIAIKSNIAVAGFRTFAGSAALAEDAPATHDAAVVTLLRKAGLNIIATTAMDELAYGFSGRNAHFGFVPNPHDASRISGGSSSGAAAAVAAGILDIAIGTDTNGSIRVPAALCGVWGLRPTAGAVPSEGIVPLSPTLDIPGPIASNARYLTALAEAVGIDVAARVNPERMKIALVTKFPAAPATPAMTAAISRFASSVGVKERVITPWAEAARAGAQVMTAFEAALAHRQLLTRRSDLLGPLLRDRLIAGACVQPEAYQRALELRASLQGQIDYLFEGHDVLLLPTVPCEAPPATWETLDTCGTVEPINAALGRCTIPFSFAGLPALSVPIHEKAASGLPIGAQLVGRPGTDGALLALARYLEETGVASAHIVDSHRS